MAKWFGKIGFSEVKEIPFGSGVWKNVITEKEYFGDVITISKRNQSTDQVNDDITIQNQISVVADPYAYQNFLSMKWIEYMDVKCKVSNVQVMGVRLDISMGGVWNEH